MNGELDARKLLKTAMGLEMNDELKYGVKADDILAMFKYLQELYAARGRTMVFQWVRIGKNHSHKGEGWSGKDIEKTFRKKGTYIVLGRAKRTGQDHEKRMRALSKKSMSEVDRANKFAMFAKGTKTNDHAISIVVDEVGGGFLYDNGCKEKTYCIVSIASRMEDVSVCYKMDLKFV